MVRKRSASEIEVVAGDECPNRFLGRRTVTSNPILDIDMSMGLVSTNLEASGLPTCVVVNNNNNNNNINSSSNHPQISNYSTTTAMLSFSAMNSSASTYTIDGSSQRLPHHQSGAGPTDTSQHISPSAVCVFSGLPLFPPVQQSQLLPLSSAILSHHSTDSSLGIGTADGLNSSSSGGGGGAAISWIDGIIKDLIHSSSLVSIPQLINNVRDIIHPCNPGLATLLEGRLRTLTSTTTTTTTTTDPDQSSTELMMLRSDMSSRNSSPQVQYPNYHNLQLTTTKAVAGQSQFLLPEQGSSAATPTGLKVYRGDPSGLDNHNAAAAASVNCSNWEPTLLPAAAATNNSTMVIPTDHIIPILSSSMDQNKMHDKAQVLQETLLPAEQKRDDETTRLALSHTKLGFYMWLCNKSGLRY